MDFLVFLICLVLFLAALYSLLNLPFFIAKRRRMKRYGPKQVTQEDGTVTVERTPLCRQCKKPIHPAIAVQDEKGRDHALCIPCQRSQLQVIVFAIGILAVAGAVFVMFALAALWDFLHGKRIDKDILKVTFFLAGGGTVFREILVCYQASRREIREAIKRCEEYNQEQLLKEQTHTD